MRLRRPLALDQEAVRSSDFEVGASLAVIQDAVEITDVITRAIVPAAFDFFEQSLSFAVLLGLIVLLTILD